VNTPSRLPTDPAEVELLMDGVCTEFERAWRDRCRPHLEDHLPPWPPDLRASLLRELIALDIEYRRRRGEQPTQADYAARFPDLDAPELSRLLAGPALAVRDSPTEALDPPADAALPVPEAIGEYEILGVLGRGGMGVVYLARDGKLKRKVALKRMRSAELAGTAELARFRAEAEAVAALQHPNIVQVFAVDEHQGQPYCVLEYLPGGTLASRLARKAQVPRWAAEMALTLALAVEAAHKAGIIHRDLKPANVLLTADGTPKISDFGLAKRLDGEPGLTCPDVVLGTPSYMAPEQAEGQKEVGPAVDVYALGAILYEMLTGRPPFQGVTPLEILGQVRTQEPVPVRALAPGVPRDLETICLKCLAKQPGRRYASARELADRLQLFLDGKPIPDRPRSWLNKAVRAIRARPILSSSIILGAVAVAVALLLLHYLDPELLRKQATRTLSAGQTYAVSGAESPGPLRPVYGDPSPLRPDHARAALAGGSHGVALWELLAGLPCERYVFSAEIQHDASNGESQVGLYCNYQEVQPSGDRPARGSFLTFGFADRGTGVTRKPDGTEVSWVALNSRLFEKSPEPYTPRAPITGQPYETLAPLKGPGPWRKLVLTVTPDGITAAWEPAAGQVHAVGSLSATEVSEALRDLAISIPKLRNVPVDFNPQAGIGLYVVRGHAAFRNITVQPIAAPR
jgi:serine/threonine protein kinase